MIEFSIFSTPKPFIGEFKIIQNNAIKSWLNLKPKPNNIFLLGNEDGVKEMCKKFEVKQIPSIKKNNYGSPLLNDLFEKINSYNQSAITIYINADIVLIDSSFNLLLKKIKNKFSKFLIIGRRYELRINKFVNKKGFKKISNIIKHKNDFFLKGFSWIDYFIFNNKLFNENEIPPFAIGRTFWDKWLVGYALKNNIPVINASEIIKAIHQSHSFNFKKNWLGEEAWNNFKLAGGIKHLYHIDDANFYITKDLILKKYKISLKKIILNFLFKSIIGNLPIKIQFLLIKIKRILIK